MALTINFNGTATRQMVFSEIQNYKAGDIITGMVHRTNGGEYEECDLDCSYCYEFKCNNLSGHEVDYMALDEYDDYGEDSYDEEYAKEMEKYSVNIDCMNEKEVIVDNSAKFRIISVESNTEEDFDREDDEPAYLCEISVELI